MSTRQDIREIVGLAIEAAGLGDYTAGSFTGSESWPIFWRKMPESPDECLVVACYGLGGPYELGVQVRVRSSRESTTSAEDRADLIRLALHGLENVTRNSTTLTLLQHTSTAELSQSTPSDTLSRDEVAVNFRALTSDANTAIEH